MNYYDIGWVWEVAGLEGLGLVGGGGGGFFVEAVEDFCGVCLREVELVGFTGD